MSDQLLPLILLAGLTGYTGVRGFQAWRRGKIVVAIVLICINTYASMCLWIKLKELL